MAFLQFRFSWTFAFSISSALLPSCSLNPVRGKVARDVKLSSCPENKSEDEKNLSSGQNCRLNVELLEHALYCEGMTWGAGHLSHPAERYAESVKGFATWSSEDKVLSFEFKSAHEDNFADISFFSHTDLAKGAHKRDYYFSYNKQGYPLDFYQEQSFFLQALSLFPGLFHAAMVSDGGRCLSEDVSDGTSRVSGLSLNSGYFTFVFDGLNRLREAHHSVEDEVFGRVKRRIRWAYGKSGGFHVQATFRGDAELDLRCRPAKNVSENSGLDTKTQVSWWPVLSLQKKRSVEERDLVDVKISENLLAIEIPKLNVRVLVLERNRDLLVFEAPYDSSVTSSVIRHISTVYPRKPIGAVLLTHFHPPHSGGVREFVARGVEVVTTRDAASYFREVARSDYSSRPDAQSEFPRYPKFKIVDAVLPIKSENAELQAIDIGPYSSHATEYLVFYFPKEKLLLQGDLISKEQGKDEVRVTSRSRGLYEAIRAHKLDVKNILGSWPIRGKARMIPYSELRKSMLSTGTQ